MTVVSCPVTEWTQGGTNGHAPGASQLAHELALIVGVLVGHLLGQRGGLTEAVGEVLVRERDEHPGPRDSLRERLPLVLGEICLACHVSSGRSGGWAGWFSG